MSLLAVRPVGGAGVPATPANTPLRVTLDRGQMLQITQCDELTGSVLEADKPVGLMGGHECAYIPENVEYCDHIEQMIPPFTQLGSEYVDVMYPPRKSGEYDYLYRIIGAVDGTTLTWLPDGSGPSSLSRGDVREFWTRTPFVVRARTTHIRSCYFRIGSDSERRR